jgi:hypothetical protein
MYFSVISKPISSELFATYQVQQAWLLPPLSFKNQPKHFQVKKIYLYVGYIITEEADFQLIGLEVSWDLAKKGKITFIIWTIIDMFGPI